MAHQARGALLGDMLPGLAAALEARKRYVDDAADSVEGSGMGLGAAHEAAGRARFAGTLFIDRSDTGYTGLVNQGATCYLNSLLQTLYMTPEFRAALYSWQYDPANALHGDDEDLCMPLQLQRLFAFLQHTERGAISTGKLTRSFGWTGAEAFQQQDVQECMSVLFEHLASAGAGGALGRHVEEEQGGTVDDYLECAECDYKRSRADKFRALLLLIQGRKSLEEALDAYIAPEELTGDNKYACPGCDKKSDARKGVRIKSLPKILTVQLQRFAFDYNTFGRVKVNDAVTFPETLDVSRWCPPASDAKGPVPAEYELFSIMNHTGSAHGGHYFAYIKDLAGGNWYCFNDSSVKTLSEDELITAFGGTRRSASAADSAAPEEPVESAADKKDTKPSASGGAGGAGEGAESGTGSKEKPVVNSSCNAYMLVYRRVDREGEHLPSAAVPAAVKALVDADNEKYLALKKDWDHEQQLLRLRLWTEGKTHMLTIHRDEPVTALVAMAHAAVAPTVAANDGSGAEEPVPLELCRLREFDTIKNLKLAPLPEDSSSKLSDTGIKNHQVVILETRAPGDDWPAWVEGGLPLMVTKLVDPETGEYGEPMQVQVVGDPTVGALRSVVEPLLELEGRCRMVVLVGEEPIVLNEEDKLLTRDLRVMPGDIVRAEACDDPTTPSRIVSLYEDLVNNVEIIYNKITPETPEGTEAARACERATIRVDQRQSLGSVKDLLAAETGVPVDQFKIRRAGARVELKDLSKPLVYFGLLGGGQIGLEKGRPLSPGEFSVKVSLYDEVAADKAAAAEAARAASDAASEAASAVAAADVKAPPPGDAAVGGAGDEAAAEEEVVSPFTTLGEIVVTADTVMPDVKAAIASQFAAAGAPPADLIRIRDRSNNKLTTVYVDTGTFGDNIRRLVDGKEIVVQRTAVPETFTDSHILLQLRQWQPAEYVLGRASERALMKDMTVKEVKEMLAEESGIPSEHIGLVKPWSWQLKDVDNIPKLKWASEPAAVATLGGKALRLRHGDCLLFKDTRVEEQWTPSAEEGAEMSKPVARSEAAFKIYTREEITVREAERKEKEAADKRERDAAEALAASVPTSGRPEVAKYVKLLKLGMSREQVLLKMQNDGIDPSLLES